MTPDLDRLIPASQARMQILADVQPTPTERVGLDQADGRILAEDLAARRTQPPFDASAMDGFAVRQADITSLPAPLTVIGESRAGVPFTGKVGPGQAVRIFTGAVVPDGADSIVIQENTTMDGACVTVLEGVDTGRFIRPAGLDFKHGQVLLKKGMTLTANRLALAASMNHADLLVHQRPLVAVMATGDELVLPGETPKAGQIIASNTFGLKAAIVASGGAVLDLGIVEDTKAALTQALHRARDQGAILVLTTGGASVGDHDLVLPTAQAFGFTFEIAKVAMRPGKPFLFAKAPSGNATQYLTGLAGNPVSSLVAFHVFVKPLIQALSGAQPDALNHSRAKLGRDLPNNDQRAEYMRARLTHSPEGEAIATPFDNQDSSMLARLVEADCLVYRPVRAPAAKAGDTCEIIRL